MKTKMKKLLKFSKYLNPKTPISANPVYMYISTRLFMPIHTPIYKLLSKFTLLN